MQRRREVQEKYHFQEPPALRMDSKMESSSAKILKLIRPSRYIETMKFKRKAWARKRVVSNPFLYGEVSFSEDDRSESASLCSPESSFAEETGFESNEEICNSPKNGEQELYENVQVHNMQGKREMPRSQSAFLPDSSLAEQSMFESGEKVSTLPARGRQDLYENVQVETVKWQNFFKTSGNVSDSLKEDGSRNVNVEIHSSSENGGQDLYENVHIKENVRNAEGQKFTPEKNQQRERRKVIQIQSKPNGQNKSRQVNQVDSRSGSNQSLPNQSLPNRPVTSVGPGISPMMFKGMADVNIPEKLDNTSMNHTEDLYVNSESYNTPCKSSARKMSLDHAESGIREEVHVDSGGRVRLSSQVFHSRGEGESSTARKSLNRVTEQSGVKEREYEMHSESGTDIQHDFPSPDYLDNDPVYTNLLQMEKDENVLRDELSKQSEDVYEVMSRVSHHEMVYHSEEQYVNYSASSRQYLQQRRSEVGMTPSVDFSGEESSQELVKHRMSFRRL
jgi:hypothetical protein